MWQACDICGKLQCTHTYTYVRACSATCELWVDFKCHWRTTFSQPLRPFIQRKTVIVAACMHSRIVRSLVNIKNNNCGVWQIEMFEKRKRKNNNFHFTDTDPHTYWPIHERWHTHIYLFIFIRGVKKNEYFFSLRTLKNLLIETLSKYKLFCRANES